MKHKTSELSGALLDLAVAKAAGLGNPAIYDDGKCYAAQSVSGGGLTAMLPWTPSTSWAQAGPLIDKWDVQLGGYPGSRHAEIRRDDDKPWETFFGATYQEAAARAIVYWELGMVVELP